MPEDAGIPPSGDAVSRFRAGEGGNAKTPGIPLPRKLADVSLRRGRADVSLRGEIGVRPLRGGHADVSPSRDQDDLGISGGHADVSPTRGQDDLSIQGGHADASPRRGHAGVSLRGRLAGVSLRREHPDVSPTRGQGDLSIQVGHASPRRGHASVSLRGRLADVSLRREHADVSPTRGQDDLSIQGGHADASPRRGHAGVSLRGRHTGVSLRRGHADVSPSRGQDDLSISDGHGDVSLTEVQNDLGTNGGNADVGLRRGQNDVGHRRGHADVSLSKGQDDLSHNGGHQPITLHESQAGVTSSRGASVTTSSTLSSSSGSSEKINSFGSTTESESHDHSHTLAQFSFQGAHATPIVVGVSHEPLLDSSSSGAIEFGGAEDSVIFGTNGFGETSSSPTSTSADGSHRFSSRGRHSESRFTITDQPKSFSARNLKDGTASDRGVGPATFFKENSGFVSTSASLVEPIEFGSEGSGTLSFPSTSGRENSPAVSLKVATDSTGSNRLRGHFTHGEKTSPVLEDQEELRSILHRGPGAEFAPTNSDGIGSLFDRGSSAAQTKDTPGRSTATSASSSAESFEGFSLKGLRGVSATSQGSVSERLPVESSSVSPMLAATGRVGRLSIGDFNSGNTGKISIGGSSATSISVHKSGSNIFSAEGSDIISASNNQEKVKEVSHTTFNVGSTSTATDGLRSSSGDSKAVANSRGRISNRDSQAFTNSRGRNSNGDSQAVTNSKARISNRDSQALTNSGGRISNRDSQAVTNSRARISNRDSQAVTNSRGGIFNEDSQAVINSRARISNRDSQAVATVRGNGGRTFINTESDAASTLIGNRQLSSQTFRKLGTISASTDRGKPNRLSVEDSDLSNSARRLGGLSAGSSGLSTGSGSARISAGQSTVASTSSRGRSFGSFSGSSSSSGSGAEEVLKTNDDSVTVIGNTLNRLPAKNSKTISASRSFPIRSTTVSVGEPGGFSKRGPGSTATFSNDLSPGGLSVGSSSFKTTVETPSQVPPNTQIFITHTDAVDGNSKNSDTAGGFSFKGLRDATASSQGSVSESSSGTGRVGKLSAGDFSADSELANSGEIGKISIRHSGTTSVSNHNTGSGKFSVRGSDVTFSSANQEIITDLSTGSNLASTSTASDGLRFSNEGSHAAAATSTGIGGTSFVNIQTDASHASLGNEELGSFSLGRLGTTTALSDTGKLNRLSAKGFGNSEGFRGLSDGSSGQSSEPAGGRSVEISARESTAASSIQDGSLGRFSVSSSRSTSGTESDLKNNLAFNSVVGDASKGSTSTNAGSFSTQGSTADSGGQFAGFSRRGPGVRASFNSDLSLGGLSVGSPTSQSSVEEPSKGSPNIPILITHSEAFNGNGKISAGSNAGERQPSVSSQIKGPFSVSKAIGTGTIIATTPNSGFTSTGELASENASGLGENGVARPSAFSNSFGDITIKHARQGLSSTSESGLSGTSGSGLFLSAAKGSSFNHRGPGSIDESNNNSKFGQSGLDTHARTRFEANSGVSKISSTGFNASKGASVSTGLRCKNRFKNQAAKILEASQTTKVTSIIKPKTNLLPSRQRSHSGVVTTQNGDASTTTHSGDASSKSSSTVPDSRTFSHGPDSRTFSHGPLTTQVSARSLIGQPVLVPIKSALSSTSTSSATSTANASPTVVTTGIGKSKAEEGTPQSSSSSTSQSSQSVHTVPHFDGTSTTNLSKVSASRSFSSPAEATEASNPVTNESAAFNRRTGTTGTTTQSDGNTPVPHFTISLNSAASKQFGSSTSSFISTDEVSQPTTAGQPIRGAFSSASTSNEASLAAPSSTHASFGSESAKGGVSSPSIVLPTSSDGPAPSRALSRVNFASIRDSAGAVVPGSSSTATSSTVNLGPQEIVQHSLFPTATTSASTSTRDSTASAPAASLLSGDATTVRGRTRVPVRTDHSSASSSIGSSQSSTVSHFGGTFPSDLPQSSASSSSSITTAGDAVSHSIKSSLFPTVSASTATGTTSTSSFESTFSSMSNTEVVPETGVPASHSSASSIIPSSSPINTSSHSSSFSTTDSSKTSVSSTSSFSPNTQRVLQLVNLGQPAFIPAASALISNRDQPSETAQSSLSKATTSTGPSQSINLVPHFSSTSPSGLSKTTNSNSISSPRSNPVTIIQSPSISALSSTGTSSKVSSSGSKLPSKVSGTTSTTLVPEERVPVSSSFVFSKPPGSSSKEFSTSSASSGTSKDNKVLQLPISHPVHIPLVSTLNSKEASTTSGSPRASERAGSKHKNALVSRIGLVSDGDLSVAPASSSSSSTAATKSTIAQKASSAASSATSSSAETSASINTRGSGNSVDSSVRESSISLSDRQAHIGNVINFATAGGARFFGTGHPPTIPTVAIPIVTSGALVEPRLGSAGTFGSNTPVFLANTVQASTPVIHSVPTTFLTGGQSNHPVVHGQNLALSSPLSIFSVPSHQIIGIDAVQG